jgi:hypothetical protein
MLALVFSVGTASAQSPKGGASDATRMEAKQLLEAMQMGKVMNQTMQGVLETQLSTNPNLAQFKDDLVLFMEKHASYEALYPDLVELYAQTYSAEELRELNRFYKSPIGQRTVELMPELMARAQQMGVQRVEDNKAELVAMVLKRMAASKP